MEIVIEGLHKRYGLRHKALQEIDLRIHGGIFGLIGTNEAGKSTLLRIVATCIRPTRGSVRIEGYDVSKPTNRQLVRRQLGYVPQELAFSPGFTGREFLDYIGLLKGLYNRSTRHREITILLEEMNLLDVADEKVATYSAGVKRRLHITQALLGDPRLIIIDDLATGIDGIERTNLHLRLLSRASYSTILFSTHHLDDIHQLCHHYAELHQGRIVAVHE